MEIELPDNIQDLKLYGIDGTEINFIDKADLDQKIKNCNIRPVISAEGIEVKGDTITPRFIISSIRIESYIDGNAKSS